MNEQLTPTAPSTRQQVDAILEQLKKQREGLVPCRYFSRNETILVRAVADAMSALRELAPRSPSERECVRAALYTCAELLANP